MNRPAVQSGDRVESVDFWRGIALVTIFVNHVPGNPFERLTHRNFGFSDAAEGFVLLAGIAAALAYGKRFEAGRRIHQGARILMRAFQVYMAHIVLVMAAAAVLGAAAIATGDLRVLDMLHEDILSGAPVQWIVGVATLGLQPGYLNILPLYVVLLAMAPVLLALARRSLALALAVSGGLYLATGLLDLMPPSYPVARGWFFNPFAWQFLFTIGLVVGLLIGDRRPAPRSPALTAAALGYLVLALVWIRAGWHHPYDLSPLPRFLWEFDKTGLHLPRLLHAVALLYVLSALPIERWIARAAPARAMVALGRNSLPVFCVGTVLAFCGQMLHLASEGDFRVDLAVIASGIAIQLGLAWALEWYKTGPRPAGEGRGAIAVSAMPVSVSPSSPQS